MNKTYQQNSTIFPKCLYLFLMSLNICFIFPNYILKGNTCFAFIFLRVLQGNARCKINYREISTMDIHTGYPRHREVNMQTEILKPSQLLQICQDILIYFTIRSYYLPSRGIACYEHSLWVCISGKLKSIVKCNIILQKWCKFPQDGLCLLFNISGNLLCL